MTVRRVLTAPIRGVRRLATIPCRLAYRLSGGRFGCAPPAPEAAAWPTVTGSTTVGQTLTTSSGLWVTSGNLNPFPITSFAYAWQQCDQSGTNCSTILGASSATYAPLLADAGHTLRSVVTATNAGGSTAQSSAPTALIFTPSLFVSEAEAIAVLDGELVTTGPRTIGKVEILVAIRDLPSLSVTSAAPAGPPAPITPPIIS